LISNRNHDIGLGLSVVRRFTEMHSAIGEGSKVFITVPVTAEPQVIA
jgi:signal transduction histidine kinase